MRRSTTCATDGVRYGEGLRTRNLSTGPRSVLWGTAHGTVLQAGCGVRTEGFQRSSHWGFHHPLPLVGPHQPIRSVAFDPP